MRAGGWRQGVAIVALVLLIAACSDGAEKVPLYATTAPPAVPAETQPIDPAWVEASGETLGTDVASGQYWATFSGVGTDAEPFIEFDLSQAFFGDACVQHFGSADDCPNDYGIVDDPHGTLPAFEKALTIVTVVGVDQRNYAITAKELLSLAGGSSPSAAAPDDYAFAPFPFLLTVSNGQITAARQIWTP